MKRRLAREYAFQLIYEASVQTEKDSRELISDTACEQDFEPDEYIEKVVTGVKEHMSELDGLITDCANERWKNPKRYSLISLSIMRLSIFEMLYLDDVPFPVSINEAVELAKKYDDDDGPKFINGILNTVAEKKGLKKKPE